MSKPKLIRVSTVPISLEKLLEGQLSFLNESYNVIAVSGNGPSLEKVKEREKVRIQALEMERRIHPFKDFISLLKLIKFFKKEKPFIVHSITPKAGLLSMIAAKICNVPVRIHTFTGLIFPSKKGFLKNILIMMDKILCSCATHIYPEGQGVKKDLIEYNITKKPLKVLANGNVNGIDTDYFDPNLYSKSDRTKLKMKLGIPQNHTVFIFVGRLVKDKGINELVAAFCSLCSIKKNVKLILVGPIENLDPLLPDTLKEIDFNQNILAVGLQRDVRAYFAIADCLVFPSYREGFPNVVIQAGAMGLPSIVTNINGCNEIINHKENGLVIPVKDTNALEKSMANIMSDVNLFNQMKSKSRKMIVDRYAQSLVWDAILAEYKKILDIAEQKI